MVDSELPTACPPFSTILAFSMPLHMKVVRLYKDQSQIEEALMVLGDDGKDQMEVVPQKYYQRDAAKEV